MIEQEVRELADELTERVQNGEILLEAMRDVCLRHAELLRALGEVGVLALDPCPRCGGRVMAGESEARCTAGCDWSYRRHGPEPVASRRADP